MKKLLIGLALLICLVAPARAATLAQLDAALDEKRMMNTVRHVADRIGARQEGSEKERQTVRWLALQLRSYGYIVRFEPVKLPDGGRSQNVIAGKAGDNGKSIFVVGAHYDSRDNTPGANDNASGVAALLEVARVLKHEPVAVRFIAFGAEERWEKTYRKQAHRLNGSNQHVASLSRAEKARIRGMISLDMVGVGNVLQIGTLPGNRAGAPLVKRLLKAAKRIGVRTESFETPPWSDHVAYAQAGVPAAWMWWYPDKLFHTPRDVTGRVSGAKMRAAARVVVRAVTEH